MAIKRYLANLDSTITNAFKSDLSTRGTGSNMGASDVVEIFSIYGQDVTGSSAAKTAELTRALFQFPIDNIEADRTAGTLPASGNVDFYLKLYNTEHASTVPRDFTLLISAISQAWEEGSGLDMENYSDLTKDSTGVNWVSPGSGSTWNTPGGDFYLDASSSFTSDFELGVEDMSVNITPLVEQWINSAGNVLGSKSNYGVGVYLTSSQEAYFSSSTGQNEATILHNLTGSKTSFYTKKFFSRGSEFFFKRPTLEARWDSSIKDSRGNFYLSSSLVNASDNLNTIYLYNYVRGKLKNIPDIATGPIYVKLFTSASEGEVLTPAGSGSYPVLDTAVTGGFVSTGVYSASFALSTSASVAYDRWSNSADTICYHTGNIKNFKTFSSLGHTPISDYALNITNLRPVYSIEETARFRLYTRKKDWNPAIYSKASSDVEASQPEDAYYKIVRIRDDLDVIGYGTGSLNHTRLSYDVSGSYFDLEMSLLEPGYAYRINFVFDLEDKSYEQPSSFKFRVD